MLNYLKGTEYMRNSPFQLLSISLEIQAHIEAKWRYGNQKFDSAPLSYRQSTDGFNVVYLIIDVFCVKD